MTKKYHLTQEEFEALKKAIENVLHLWEFNFIKAHEENGAAMSMSKDVFFECLEREFVVEKK